MGRLELLHSLGTYVLLIIHLDLTRHQGWSSTQPCSFADLENPAIYLEQSFCTEAWQNISPSCKWTIENRRKPVLHNNI
jgi:hypothetical protein